MRFGAPTVVAADAHLFEIDVPRDEVVGFYIHGVALFAGDVFEVGRFVWPHTGAQKRLADRLVALLPAHKTFVEPFAGSAAVLFAKDPAETEVINDADPEIAQAFRLIKRLTRKQLEQLQGMKWTGDEATFKRLIDASPTDDVTFLVTRIEGKSEDG